MGNGKIYLVYKSNIKKLLQIKMLFIYKLDFFFLSEEAVQERNYVQDLSGNAGQNAAGSHVLVFVGLISLNQKTLIR